MDQYHDFKEKDLRHALHRYGPPKLNPYGRFDREQWDTVTKVRLQSTTSLRRPVTWKFTAAAFLIGGMFTALGLLRPPAPTTVGQRPILEVVKWINNQIVSHRATLPQYRTRLEKISHALATARPIRNLHSNQMTSAVSDHLPITPVAADSVPILYLAYNTGQVVSIMPYHTIARPKNTLSIHRPHPNRVVIDRNHRYEVVDSAYLAQLLGSTPLWTPADLMTVSVNGTHVSIHGQGLVTNRVILTVSPLLKGIGGGESGEPADFVLVTVPVKNGSYHWSGTVHIPKHWTVYRTVIAWAIAADAKAPTKWPTLGSYNVGKIVSLPLSAKPVTAIKTASQALGALQEWAYAAQSPWNDAYPVWPTKPGQESVAWINWAGHRWHGHQTTRAIPVRGGYRVTITCIATSQRNQRTWSTTWFVHRNTLVTGLRSLGEPPRTMVKQLLVPTR